MIVQIKLRLYVCDLTLILNKIKDWKKIFSRGDISKMIENLPGDYKKLRVLNCIFDLYAFTYLCKICFRTMYYTCNRTGFEAAK